MSLSPPLTAASVGAGPTRRGLRLGFVGPPAWLQASTSPGLANWCSTCRVPVLQGSDTGRLLHDLELFSPHVTVVYDPACVRAEWLRQLPGATLGVLLGGPVGIDAPELVDAAGALDRVLSFRPAMTGTQIGPAKVWRAIPPPINDGLFGEVRPLHDRPRVMALGRSTSHREYMLMQAKHTHDLLQVIHGVNGEALVQLLRECDVGVYVPPGRGGSFGAQVGIHLAAGQLLFAQGLDPAHGLERGIDYVRFDSPGELVWALDRLQRFPEMYQRLRIRGRMKAERYRASTMFARIAHDLLADVAAFGSPRT